LTAGLRPDPLGELERSPSRNWGEGCLLLRGEGKEWEKGRKEMGRGRKGGGRKGEGWEARGEEGGKGRVEFYPAPLCPSLCPHTAPQSQKTGAAHAREQTSAAQIAKASPPYNMKYFYSFFGIIFQFYF